MRPIVLLCCCLALAMAADDAYAAWWRRADAALAAGDAARVAGDPPPGAAGGEALAHHRLLAAWLGGDARTRARVGGLLQAVRTASGAAVRLIDPAAPLTAVPDAGAALWADEVAGGPQAWRDFVRTCAGDGDVATAPGLWLARSAEWTGDPVAAAARYGGERPPTVPEAEIDAVWFAARVQDGDDLSLWTSAASQVFRYRVRAACAQPWWPVADALSEDDRPAASGGDVLRLAEAAMAQPAAARLALPALALWAHRCEHEGEPLLRSATPRQGLDLLRHCLDDPARAGAEARRVRALLADLAAAHPDAAEPEAGPDLGSAIQFRMGAAAAAEDLRILADALQELAAGDAAALAAGPMLLWGDDERAAATARIDACEAAVREAADRLQSVVVGPGESGVQPTLSTHDWVLERARAVVARAGGRGAAGRRALDAARAELAEAYAAWHAEVVRAAVVVAAATGAALPLPPRHLALGDDPCPAPAGWTDDAGRDDAALLAACPGPEAGVVAAHLVALRRDGAGRGDLLAAWSRLQRRHAAYAALAAAARPDLDLIADDPRAPVGRALAAAARAGRPPAPEAAVRAWIDAATRPLPGRIAAAAPDRAWIAREVFLMRAIDLAEPWEAVARWIAEGGERAAERLALAERLSRLPAADGPMRAAAELVGRWAEANRRVVAAAFAQAALAGWPGRDALLRAARDYVEAAQRGLP